MKTSSTAAVSAALLGTAALFTTSLFAEDACCKDGCCDQKTGSTAYGLTGDWGGFRNTLREKGIEFHGNYAAELFANPKGGKRRSGVFDGLLKLTLNVDLQKAVGWNDATFAIGGLYPHGTSGTLRNVGDASFFSNIDAYDTYRLVDLWIEQKLMEGKLALKVGQMRVDDEFGVTDTAALFINATFGVPNPVSTNAPLPIYPVGALGVRLRFEPMEGLYGMVGLYDGNPSPGDLADPSTGVTGTASRHGTDWAIRQSEGVLWAGELGYQRSGGSYPGALRLGFLSHTDTFADVGGASAHPSNTSSYFVVDQTLWQKKQGSQEGLAGFLRGTLAQKGSSKMDHTTQFGLVYTGLAGEQDKVGLAYANNHFSPNQKDVAGNPKTRESVAELSYQIPLQPYLRVQPDFQYISRPGGSGIYNDAWVIGIRAILDF